MSTIINNPGGGETETGIGIGMVLGILVVLAVVILFVFYGIPALRNNTAKDTTTTIKIEVPNPVQTNKN